MKSLLGTLVMLLIISKLSVYISNFFLCTIVITIVGAIIYALIELLLRNEPAFFVRKMLKIKA